MEITVNNQIHIIDHPCSVNQLITAVLQISATSIAVAVNETVVPKSDWLQHALQRGDRIILIKAIQGG